MKTANDCIYLQKGNVLSLPQILPMAYNFDQRIDRSGTSSVKYDLRSFLFGNADVLPMWVADMDFETPDFIRDAVIRRAQHPIYGYTLRPEEYYTSLIRWMKSHHNWDLQKDDILFCPGVVPALNLAVLAFTEPGDEVIIQPPVYHPFFGAVTDHQRTLIQNQLLESGQTYRINFEELERQATTAKMLILCNPHNPVGRCWSADELRQVADICTRHQVLVVSDEIHGDLVLPGNRHQVFACLSDEAAAISISMHAPSKTFNLAGMATSSVIISNPELRERFSGWVNRLHLWLGNLFGAEASIAAYTHGETWRQAMLTYIQGNIDYVEGYLEQHIPNIRMVKPEATYMIWLDFRAFGLEPDVLKQRVIEGSGLGLNPGTEFGAGGEGFMRMNLACPREVVVDAMERLGQEFAP